MNILIPLLISSFVFANEPPRRACAQLLWPAFTGVDHAMHYPLRDGQLKTAAILDADLVTYASEWGPSVWSREDFAAWSKLTTSTARSAERARDALLRLGNGERIEGLSEAAHRRVRSATVIFLEGERIEDAAYRSNLVKYGIISDRSAERLSAFTGNFGPAIRPHEYVRLTRTEQSLAYNQASLDASSGEAPALRALMREEARSLRLPFARVARSLTLRGEDAIYLIRSLLREALLRRLDVALDEDARFLTAFHPELFSIWPQLESWRVKVHDLELSLNDSYFNTPHLRFTADDFLDVQLRRDATMVDRSPYREDATASLLIRKDDVRHPVFMG